MTKINQGWEVKKNISSNSFGILQFEKVKVTLDTDGSHSTVNNKEEDKGEKEKSHPNLMEKIIDMDMMKDDIDDMVIGYLDLDGLEKAVQDPEKGAIPSQQEVLLKEAIIKTRKAKPLEWALKTLAPKDMK